MYKDTIPYLLENNYHIKAPDFPGHGESLALGPFTFSRSTPLLHEAMTSIRNDNASSKIVIVGISMGGQAVLDLLAHYPGDADAAVISGVSIHPPDDKADWEMPHLPSSPEWMEILREDVARMGGMEKAHGLRWVNFGFTLKDEPGRGGEGEVDKEARWPPVLVVVGEHDLAMARRDFDELSGLMKVRNARSDGTVLRDAWHTHSIDVPEKFAKLVDGWVKNVFEEAP